MQNRLVVFTSSLNYSVCLGIVQIDNRIHGANWLVVCHSPPREFRRLLRNQWANLKRNGWRWIPYQIADVLDRLAHRLLGSPDRDDPGFDYTPAALATMPNLRLECVDDIHSAASRDLVRQFAPDIGLSIAAPILKKSIFALPERGTINLHKGRVPDYRGMPPAFWEFWNDEASVGCTVHQVEESLDTGDLIAETSVPREQFSTVRGMQIRLDEVGADLMATAVETILSGEAGAVPQRPGGRTYRKPVLSQVAELRRRAARSQPSPGPHFKNLAKNSLGLAAYAFWIAGGRLLFQPRITVLLYHRVSDEVRDNLTVGVEQFERQMAIVRRYCEPVSLESVIAEEVVGRSALPRVAVTFDDGYLDNYENAAPILLRHRVPAAFFVSTRIIGTADPFPHDVVRGNAPIPTMRWDHIRQMRDAGFTIGSHACRHIDCAAEPEEVVRAELAQSRDDLQRELGLDDTIFAYPYGGREHMTDERLELVREAGYRACLSAYGGTNAGRVDRFNVLRKGINWEFSDQAFLLECLGLR